MVDSDGSRWLLGDYLGRLFLLVLQKADDRVSHLHLEPLGTTSISSTLSYLDNGVVFIGSQVGDSQLIKLTEEKSSETNAYFEVLDAYTNLSPIVDMCVVDVEKQGQGQIVTCSGAFKDGSLRVVRNGVGINEQASLEIPGVSGVWAVKRDVPSSMDLEEESSSSEQEEGQHNMLAISLIGQTHFLQLEGEEMSPIEDHGDLVMDQQTIFCGNISDKLILQITPNEARVLAADNFKVLGTWEPGELGRMNVCAATGNQILVGAGSSKVVYLEVDQQTGSLTLKGQTKLSEDISCLDITPVSRLGGSSPGEAQLCVVGLWDVSVAIVKLPTLEVVAIHSLGGEIIARSVLLVELEGLLYLLVGLGDGHLLTYVVEEDGQFSDKRKLSLGTQPIQLHSFTAKGQRSVFASSDRPTVIYSKNKKLLYSNVNLKSVTSVCCFSASSYPDSLVIVSEDQLMIGSIDEIQKLHIRTVPLNECPFRITYVEDAKAYAIITASEGDEAEETSWHLRLLDEKTFDLLNSFQLDEAEEACSIGYMKFTGDPTPHVVVGTAYIVPTDHEPSKGRILVFSIIEQKFVLDVQFEVQGAVYSLDSFNGKLLAAINSKVQLFSWSDKDGQELKPEVTVYEHTVALFVRSRGDFVVVGDMIMSMRLLLYKEEEAVLAEIAKDHNPKWITAIEILDDDTYIGAENSFNLVTLRKNNEGTTIEEREHLEEAGLFHVGDFINSIRHGSLVMALPETGEAAIPTTLFSTVGGSIGVIASLPYKDFEFFSKVEGEMRKVVKGIGGLEHQAWRSFKSERRRAESCGFIDGDLVETFLDLPRVKMEEVVRELGVTVEELTRRIQSLARQLH